ncbi:uncharacterized protein BCR38DRAFT_427272 [Pseudomassariella vexata]|uniref:F-box domain-containing protein n=1 Tax=Pseudomassariella vexata TaxID=1141098 RepID=A0A1Y2E7U7_9PEZI|nr:uncharacterized protein BCR38DRAFT_427272 [Pseudomassariella vexata]ORY67507.1 hypothetical protein BCR38DRAFT_427272 [Pseudomassariella vexata]
MPRKRVHSDTENDKPPSPITKRIRLSRDFLSPLSDELLVRILTFLPLPDLLNVAPVSNRFHRLAQDSQIWKHLYYTRFVLPRALRIPGFRHGVAREGKLHYSSRKAVWADGRRGGWVDMRSDDGDKLRDWKRQYKLRHNWSRGKCAVEELNVGSEMAGAGQSASRKMLVKVVEGTAVTADAASGLRAWDLRTKELVAHIDLSEASSEAAPSCLAIDDQNIQGKMLNVVVGFIDGSFGIWRIDVGEGRITRRHRHEKSSNGKLASAALSYPYLLTATESVLISLYTFEGPVNSAELGREEEEEPESEAERGSESKTARDSESHSEDQPSNHRGQHDPSKARLPQGAILAAPYLLTSLKSHTCRAPLALSIRKTSGTTVASIAYTFSTLQGWSLGIQDLHLRPSASSSKRNPIVTTSRLAYTLPVKPAPSQMLSPPRMPSRPPTSSTIPPDDPISDGPTNICYTHPYLLATLPDNTLILHLCTSNASSLSISPGIRLWGHTSGISDAEITARGKAVSVSCHGEEIRVWELEGRAAEGRSIEVRPTASNGTNEPAKANTTMGAGQSGFGERRNWVGFDDEMVIVLKESSEKESLLVYDFT